MTYTTIKKTRALEKRACHQELSVIMPYVVRNKIRLIGGVKCQVGNNHKHGKTCTKPTEVYELDLSQVSSQEWQKSGNLIGIPRSSHAVVVVPTSIDFNCRVF